MYKHLIFAFFVQIFSNSLIKAQTSVEEYNYLTKGYKIYQESGIDIKQGYSDVSVDIIEVGNRRAELKAFIKLSINKPVAYLLIYSYRNSLNELQKEYICVPHPESNNDIKNLFWGQLEKSGDTAARLRIISFILGMNLNWYK